MKFKGILVFLFLTMAFTAQAEDANDLFSAAVQGNVARVEALLAQGIDVNSPTSMGRTALMGASFNGNVGTIKALLSYGADVNRADRLGNTALMDALVFGRAEIVSLLLSAGADVNAVDKLSMTVLGKAKKAGHANIIKLLEAAGAKEAAILPDSEPPTETSPVQEDQSAAQTSLISDSTKRSSQDRTENTTPTEP